MRTRTISIFLLCLLAAFSLKTVKAQDKRPEAIPDFYNVNAYVNYQLKPMFNDIVEAGHTTKLFQVIGLSFNTITFNDSIIFYQTYLGFSGIDSLRYRIRDQQNGLISEWATITFNVSNFAFDSIDINQINAKVNPSGYLFNSFGGYSNSNFEFPKGSSQNMLYNVGLNLAGVISGETEYLSGSVDNYGYNTDYYPGPVTTPENYSYQLDSAWVKVWKLNKNEIQLHIQNYNKEGYNMPDNLRHWPANGNVIQGQAAQLAPYHDFNENGMYDPENGDYPLIRGDQAIYFVYNDVRYPHQLFSGIGMGAEIHCMVYAFESPDNEAINNTIFINYLIYNRGQNTLDELKPGIFSTAGLGNLYDNFAGCSPELNMGFYYNGDDFDEDTEGVGYFYPGYGNHPPAFSMKLLNRELSGYLPYFTHETITSFSPQTNEDLIYNLNAFWLDGAPLIGNGCGHPSCAQGDTVSFVYTGDPSVAGSWSELQQGNISNYRSSMLLVEPVYDFRPGDAVCIDLALTTARDMNGNHIDSFVLLKEYAAQVQEFYNENFPASCFDVAPGFEEAGTPAKESHLTLIPNPAEEEVTVKTNHTEKPAHYRIFDVSGRLKLSGQFKGAESQTINIKSLKPGLYFVQVLYGMETLTSKLVKK